ncbi:MAG TPA: hypothetical protein VMP11_15195 [Verrucomicrobiae bacterium]|nr:hypothetical protein [Verrucomicrobiae bacterium]
MRYWRKVTILVLAATVLLLLARQNGWSFTRPRRGETYANGRDRVEVISQPYTLDRLYMSMTGPCGNHPVDCLLPHEKSQLVWLTGLQTEVLDADSRQVISPEFCCHANLTFDPQRMSPERHNAEFDNSTHMDWRFFTLVPGRLHVSLPTGYGIPVLSDTPLDFFSMSLNLNVTDRTVKVRFKTTIDFVRDADATASMKPLFRRALYVVQPLAGSGMEHMKMCASMSHPGEGCIDPLSTNTTGAVISTKDGVQAQFGSDVTFHWMVPPGRHAYRSKVVAGQLNLSEPTTVHYATAHLHPYGESLELYDLTAQRSVLKIDARDYSDKVGVARMGEFQSEAGMLITPAHQYELRAEYNNTTSAPSDAMAILYLYLLERDFHRPAVKNLQAGGDSLLRHMEHFLRTGFAG